VGDFVIPVLAAGAVGAGVVSDRVVAAVTVSHYRDYGGGSVGVNQGNYFVAGEDREGAEEGVVRAAKNDSEDALKPSATYKSEERFERMANGLAKHECRARHVVPLRRKSSPKKAG